MINNTSQISKTLLIKELEAQNVFKKPVGVGTLIERTLSKFGITEATFKKAFKLDTCGCSKRKQWLDELITLYHEDKL